MMTRVRGDGSTLQRSSRNLIRARLKNSAARVADPDGHGTATSSRSPTTILKPLFTRAFFETSRQPSPHSGARGKSEFRKWLRQP